MPGGPGRWSGSGIAGADRGVIANLAKLIAAAGWCGPFHTALGFTLVIVTPNLTCRMVLLILDALSAAQDRDPVGFGEGR